MCGFAMPENDQNNDGQYDDSNSQDTDSQQQGGNEPPAWKAPASQEELDRLVERRLKQERRKYSDYDALKAKAEQFDTLAAASQTDQERVAEEAELRGFSTAIESTTPRLVRAEFRAAAKGVITKDQLDALIEDLDLTRYVDDDGEPDVERIERKISAVAPKAPTPSFGQGARGQAPKAKDMNDFIRQVAGLR